MHLEEPHNINSGQYFATLVAPHFGIMNRNEFLFEFSMPWSRLASTSASGVPLDRWGRPQIKSEFKIARWLNQRLIALVSGRPPLVSGQLVTEKDRYWEVSRGARYAYALNSHYRFQLASEIFYNTEVVIKDPPSEQYPGEPGHFYQKPVLVRPMVGIARTWNSDSLQASWAGVYSVVTGRTIHTNDPKYSDAHVVITDEPIRFSSLHLDYHFSMTTSFFGTIGIWKSIENNYHANEYANPDGTEETAALGIVSRFDYSF